MASLNDLFTSYKIVNEPEITIPIYDPNFTPSYVNTPIEISKKVQALKTKLLDFTRINLNNSGKDLAYTLPHDTPLSTKNFSPKPLPKTKLEWKTQLEDSYRRAGCSELFIKNLVGQDALESGWGAHAVGDYNYGNIKAGKSWKGRSKKAHDKREGSYDAYRSYDSLDLYVQDKLRLLKTRYKITGNESSQEFTDKLIAGGYATGANYKTRVLKTIASV